MNSSFITSRPGCFALIVFSYCVGLSFLVSLCLFLIVPWVGPSVITMLFQERQEGLRWPTDDSNKLCDNELLS